MSLTVGLAAVLFLYHQTHMMLMQKASPCELSNPISKFYSSFTVHRDWLLHSYIYVVRWPLEPMRAAMMHERNILKITVDSIKTTLNSSPFLCFKLE